MTTAARSNGFPNLTMGSSSNDKNAQPIGSTFGHSAWQPNGIWGNGTLMNSLSAHRDTSGSRGSEDLSPGATSGSAQLNPLSEAVPWGTSKGNLWNQSASSATPIHGPSHSGSVSPTRTKDGFHSSFTDISSNSRAFQQRSSISHNPSNIPNRTMPPGPVDPTAPSFRYGPSFGDSVGEEKGNTSSYGVVGASHLGFDPLGAFRRNSTDPNLLTMASHRTGSLGARQADVEAQTPSTRYNDVSHFALQKTSGHPKPQNHRPSIPNTSTALAAEASRALSFRSTDNSNHDLDDAFDHRLNLEDNSDPAGAAYANHGYATSSNQPFQFNPGSQPWRNEFVSNQGPIPRMNQDTWMDASHTGPFVPKKNSMERPSPVGSSYAIGSISPGGYSGTPNQRSDPWARPASRDPRMFQDIERHQNGSPYLHQQARFCTSPYYGSNLGQYPHPYEPYMQPQSFRHHVPANYSLQQMQYIGGIQVPIRPSRDHDPVKGVRSALLEEFRANTKSTKRYELKDIYNHIVEFSGDQHGSRFIQEKLQTANSDEKDQVFREIEPNSMQLMKDVFGNYVIQKFFEHGNQIQKRIIAEKMRGKITELSTQMYACRVVQKALEHVLVEQQGEIVAELKPVLMRMVKDQNANHVIQKIIEVVPRLCVPFIVDEFQGQIEYLASHNYGCRVIQRILEHGTEAERDSLMVELRVCAPKLISDQYGNYVTQHIIKHGAPEDRSRMIQHVIDKLLLLSKHKFASNVVETCIEKGTPEQRRDIRIQLTAVDSDGTSPLQLIMKDQYGNYVIQKLIECMDATDRESFLSEMRPQITALKKTSTGRQITALESLLSVAVKPPPRPMPVNNTNVSTATSATSPSPPNLPVDVISTLPTPSLTMEQNSPQSSSPPSTNNSTIEETMSENKLVPTGQSADQCPAVQVDEP